MQRANVYFRHGHLIHLLLFDVEELGQAVLIGGAMIEGLV